MCGKVSSLSETMSTVGNSELDMCRGSGSCRSAGRRAGIRALSSRNGRNGANGAWPVLLDEAGHTVYITKSVS